MVPVALFTDLNICAGNVRPVLNYGSMSNNNRFVSIISPGGGSFFLSLWLDLVKIQVRHHTGWKAVEETTRGLEASHSHHTITSPLCLFPFCFVFSFFVRGVSLHNQSSAKKCKKKKKRERESGRFPPREMSLLLVVVFAVKFPFSEVTAGGERLLTHGALQTLLVPWGVVDSHQEAVGDGSLASFTHGGMMTFSPWKKKPRKEFEARQETRAGLNHGLMDWSVCG